MLPAGVSTLTGFALAVEIGDWQRFTGATVGAYRAPAATRARGHEGNLRLHHRWQVRRRQRVQGSTSSTPVRARSLMFRVAQVAPLARQIAAIWASAVLMGIPARSRATRTCA